MSTLWRWISAFGGFWYQFVIGDDWLGAAGVVVAIAAVWGLVELGWPAYWLGPLVIIATATALVARGLRSGSHRTAV